MIKWQFFLSKLLGDVWLKQTPACQGQLLSSFPSCCLWRDLCLLAQGLSSARPAHSIIYVGWFVRPVLLLECRWIPVYLYGSSRFFTGVSQLSQLSQLAFVQLWPWLLVLTGYFYGIIHSINVFFSTYNWYIKGHNCKFYHVCLGFYMVFRWFLYGFLGFPMVFRWFLYGFLGFPMVFIWFLYGFLWFLDGFYFEPQLHLLFFPSHNHSRRFSIRETEVMDTPEASGAEALRKWLAEVSWADHTHITWWFYWWKWWFHGNIAIVFPLDYHRDFPLGL